MSHDMKYTILRRAICYGKDSKSRKMYDNDELKILCQSLEGKDEGQLKEIHKQWIGY